jgi:hypothetical protein
MVAVRQPSIATCGLVGKPEGKMSKGNGKTRFFYAAKSFMGINFTYDSPCWKAYRFDSAKARDEWVKDNEYENGNLVAEAVTRKIAMRIIGYKTSAYADSVVGVDDFDGSLYFRLA